MLVLSRHKGEKIVLPSLGITICVVDIIGKESRVKIGIEAPQDVPVHREEVARAIEREQAGEGKE